MTKRRLNTLLGRGTVAVTFIKQDGSQRFMRCTKNPTLIPKRLLPKKPSAAPVGIVRVFDEDVRGWRSFQFSSVKTVISSTRNGGLLVEHPGEVLAI